jgi:hypothetical protein
MTSRVLVPIRLDPLVKQALVEVAGEWGVSFTRLVNEMLEAMLRRDGRYPDGARPLCNPGRPKKEMAA